MSAEKISPAEFYDLLVASAVDLFAGVPDSLLQDLAAYIQDHCPTERNIITANEGNAVALAGGYHVATARFGAVYLQNSGLGNTVNPLLSLADPDVYALPMLLIIGWRGEPGVKDEPQHVAQGRLTLPILDTLGIDYAVLDPNGWRQQVTQTVERMARESRPLALVVRKGTFDTYRAAAAETELTLSRERALEEIIGSIDARDFIVSTTGKTSREVFEIRERRGEGHGMDFLTVGGMGHAGSIAMGMSLGTDRRVYCIDGDGAFLMHLGSVPIMAIRGRPNLRYILINNGAHESVGGQPTVAFDLDIPALLRAVGFQQVETARSSEGLADCVRRLADSPKSALIIEVAQGSRPELGRPSSTARQNKEDMMREFAVGRDR